MLIVSYTQCMPAFLVETDIIVKKSIRHSRPEEAQGVR